MCFSGRIVTLRWFWMESKQQPILHFSSCSITFQSLRRTARIPPMQLVVIVVSRLGSHHRHNPNVRHISVSWFQTFHVFVSFAKRAHKTLPGISRKMWLPRISDSFILMHMTWSWRNSWRKISFKQILYILCLDSCLWLSRVENVNRQPVESLRMPRSSATSRIEQCGSDCWSTRSRERVGTRPVPRHATSERKYRSGRTLESVRCALFLCTRDIHDAGGPTKVERRRRTTRRTKWPGLPDINRKPARQFARRKSKNCRLFTEPWSRQAFYGWMHIIPPLPPTIRLQPDYHAATLHFRHPTVRSSTHRRRRRCAGGLITKYQNIYTRVLSLTAS